MATLDWHLTRTGGVTLVELLVTTESPCTIRIESALEPVWPPRVQGVPAAGWQNGSFEAALDGDDRLIIGYASPAAPVEPPAELTTEPPNGSDSLTPRDLIRALGDGKPPRDSVPSCEIESTGQTTQAGPVAESRAADSPPPPQPPTQQSTPSGDGPSVDTGGTASAPPDTLEIPGSVAPWLDAIEQRLAAATGRSPDAGTEHGDSATDTDGHRHLERQLATDRQQLAQLGRRQQELCSRLDALDSGDGDCKR